MRALVVLLGFAILSTSARAEGEHSQESASCVVLLHGLWRTSLSMKALQWRLEDIGYRVINPTYPSLAHPVQELSVIAVEEGLAGCSALHLDRVHFVTHSLGGILVRQYLARSEIPGLQRVVMLGPPNQGSQMADYADSLSLLEPFMPRAVAQLGTSEESVPRQLGRVSFPLGVIAGTANYLPFLPGQTEEPGDGTVAVSETLVPGMTDFLELPVSHSLMMWDDEVIEQVVFFLEHGVFQRQSPPFSAP
ncbi:esterase/lipase family protein [Pseudomonadota bacterium]